MDGKSSERVAAFERHMSVNWGELARAEIASGIAMLAVPNEVEHAGHHPQACRHYGVDYC